MVELTCTKHSKIKKKQKKKKHYSREVATCQFYSNMVSIISVSYCVCKERATPGGT